MNKKLTVILCLLTSFLIFSCEKKNSINEELSVNAQAKAIADKYNLEYSLATDTSVFARKFNTFSEFESFLKQKLIKDSVKTKVTDILSNNTRKSLGVNNKVSGVLMSSGQLQGSSYTPFGDGYYDFNLSFAQLQSEGYPATVSLYLYYNTSTRVINPNPPLDNFDLSRTEGDYGSYELTKQIGIGYGSVDNYAGHIEYRGVLHQHYGVGEFSYTVNYKMIFTGSLNGAFISCQLEYDYIS